MDATAVDANTMDAGAVDATAMPTTAMPTTTSMDEAAMDAKASMDATAVDANTMDAGAMEAKESMPSTAMPTTAMPATTISMDEAAMDAAAMNGSAMPVTAMPATAQTYSDASDGSESFGYPKLMTSSAKVRNLKLKDEYRAYAVGMALLAVYGHVSDQRPDSNSKIRKILCNYLTELDKRIRKIDIERSNKTLDDYLDTLKVELEKGCPFRTAWGIVRRRTEAYKVCNEVMVQEVKRNRTSLL
ncbi:hypothetical protein GNI_092750 [Gregarina niphandrodes]|uniref:Uncharacterized protein n=1 Tax=Gregarina niphandrodes TaxID=110365 RepID=A0A023B5B7_GRENI|nr:hypothetical protein GNI_092750 [Gregarina niphandrodes]EZG59209.1 hypothetical protein GNI_092750 [Gregarina niphandrodes]|eukprot:XP_011130900.1 hypothetical protein GNI_092750 [Gregarina niphandrodes]